MLCAEEGNKKNNIQFVKIVYIAEYDLSTYAHPGNPCGGKALQYVGSLDHLSNPVGDI